MNVGNVTGFMHKIDSVITGADPASLENKASLFRTSCNLLKKRDDMNFSHVENLVDRKTQGKPPGNGFAIVSDFGREAGLLEEGRNLEAGQKDEETGRRPGEQDALQGDSSSPEAGAGGTQGAQKRERI